MPSAQKILFCCRRTPGGVPPGREISRVHQPLRGAVQQPVRRAEPVDDALGRPYQRLNANPPDPGQHGPLTSTCGRAAAISEAQALLAAKGSAARPALARRQSPRIGWSLSLSPRRIDNAEGSAARTRCSSQDVLLLHQQTTSAAPPGRSRNSALMNKRVTAQIAMFELTRDQGRHGLPPPRHQPGDQLALFRARGRGAARTVRSQTLELFLECDNLNDDTVERQPTIWLVSSARWAGASDKPSTETGASNRMVI